MKALVQKGVGARARLDVAQITAPAPKAGEVLIRVEAAGINGSDWEGFSGRPAYGRIMTWFKPRPNVIGNDVVGIVEAVGAGVEIATGVRVIGDTMNAGRGTCAALTTAKAAAVRSVLAGLETEIGLDALACLPQSGAIVRTAFDGHDLAGKRVLINGAGGGAGPMAIAYAKHLGAHVTAVDQASKSPVMVAAGADEVIDYAAQDFTALGLDWALILDLFGTRPARQVARALSDGGQYRIVGGLVPAMLSCLIAGRRFRKHGKDIGVLAVGDGPAHLPEIMDLARAGVLAPIIGRVVALEDAPAAFADFGRGAFGGKLVIRP